MTDALGKTDAKMVAVVESVWDIKDQGEGTLSVNDLVCRGASTVFDRF